MIVALHWIRRYAGALAGLVLLLAAGAGAAEPIETSAKQAFILDFQTGTVLYEKNPDVLIHPASMSKLMTVYLLFEALKAGRVKLDDTFPVSEAAWALNEGSTMFVGINSRIAVEDLIRGIVVQSGNDACLVVAEGLAGSEAAFADQMNKKAAELGLAHSHFTNPHGLEDPNHKMTVRDLATLAHRLITDFPEYYHYFSEKEFVFNGIKQGNRNPLLYRDPSVDGLKTGHLTVSGFGVTISAVRDGRRVIMVLDGMSDMQERADEAQRMLDWAFREFDDYTLAKAGAPLADAPVWLGEQPSVPLTVASDLVVTLPRATHDQIVAKAVFDGPLPAPVAAGQPVGNLVIASPGMPDMQIPLVAATDVPKLGFFGRVIASVKHFIGIGA
jgi:serine-type D-Ala-D-Ala carboxypeptidase (penicillin-binding protein 5/6)